MNILFLYGGLINPTKGGVERVTKVLADYFELQGNSGVTNFAETRNFIQKFKKTYNNSDRIIIPKSIDELNEIIKSIKN